VLEASGWTVLVVWECETQDNERLDHLHWCIRGATPDNVSRSRAVQGKPRPRGKPLRITP
jgi:G:T-mismatch repair DNA endonuclease (very short patch repair protein)